MLANLESLSLHLGIPLESLMAAGIGFSVLLLVFGLSSAFKRPDRAVVRLREISGGQYQERLDRGLLIQTAADPGWLMKAFVPGKKSELTALQRKLAQAGLHGADALRVYTLFRVMLALGLPLAYICLLMLARIPAPPMPDALAQWLAARSAIGNIQIIVILLAMGYYVPHRWLEDKAKARQLRIEESFPNALDLMQISVEAGLGFDAAMVRVANEIRRSAPDLSAEFQMVQLQIQAGRPREEAMRNLAERVGLETFRAFASVVQQSLQFGTSMSQAMTTYADELRQTRELRAQEMANKLPVKMSGVMASLMLPALVLLTVGPVLIRYVHTF